MKEPDSPCIKNCCLNQKDICIGCFRSLEEILQWGRPQTTAQQKITILANCTQRQQAFKNNR